MADLRPWLVAIALLLLAALALPIATAQPNGSADEDHDHRLLEAGQTVDRRAVAIAAGAAALVTFGGGAAVLVGKRISDRRIHLLLGVTAGLLLAIAFVDLIPEALEQAPASRWTLAFSLLALIGVQLVIGHEHGAHDHGSEAPGHHATSPAHSTELALVAFGALAFHRLVDGLVLPAAFAADAGTGLAAAGGILLHQLPDGIAGASLFLAAGWTRRNVLLGLIAMALFTPLGSLLGLMLTGISGLLGHLVALAAATFIFVALAELLPELQSPRYRWLVGAGFALGYALQIAIELGAGHV